MMMLAYDDTFNLIREASKVFISINELHVTFSTQDINFLTPKTWMTQLKI